ncbi:MAG TPA: bifunctional oligoribonuclease/PAP phosphatase NrnA [Holophaga sp.]|nr:bifunctional oligoribonuclease/PAP phosphatase NrnA [Holophaga sp.]HPS68535.1 bifunctional oligoribonuclease/PAP phosphatase NrnA [Holophaga sp.]
MLARFCAGLRPHRRILLATHENPDVDGIGAVQALACYLRGLGKEVRVVVTPVFPAFLGFLDPEGRVETFRTRQDHEELGAWPDAWVLVDASEPGRMGAMREAFAASKAVKICLDHHLKADSRSFDMDFTDPDASASAELVFDLVEGRMSRPLPAAIVTALYAGLVDDTGNFRFSNATPRVHRIGAALIEDGADPAGIYQQLYHQDRMEKLKLYGKAYESLRILGDGRYGCLSLRRKDLLACGAVHEDMDGLVNEPLRLRGVEVAALLYETDDGRIKASLRSRGKIDVNAICRQFGGGGHRLASGAKLDGPLEQVQTRVDAAVLAQLPAQN